MVFIVEGMKRGPLGPLPFFVHLSKTKNMLYLLALAVACFVTYMWGYRRGYESGIEVLEKKIEFEESVANQLHKYSSIESTVSETIWNAFEKYEPEVWKTLEFHIGSDWYDNSIEIYIENHLPYPYEPSWKVRDEIYALGFDIVYWNFADEKGEFTEEIRGSEPRRICRFMEKPGPITTMGHIHIPGIGYVDDRFDEKKWDFKK